MKFAKYWQQAETRLDKPVFGQSVFRIWGASNESEADARNAAENRASKFRRFVESGFTKREEYEYWAGFLKEEVLDEIRSGDDSVLAAVTRNHYGATVLNSGMVLFGDIDIPDPGWADSFLGLFGRRKRDKEYYVGKIGKYQEKHPELAFRVYETFAGLRFIVTSGTHSSKDDFVTVIFKALGVDPIYWRLCQRQDCFRARLTPKPWRLGLDRPPSRFPRKASEQAEFDAWLRDYSQACADKSAAKFLKSFGSERMDRNIQKLVEVHDRLACTRAAELA